jgi:hypothetical protein
MHIKLWFVREGKDVVLKKEQKIYNKINKRNKYEIYNVI